MSQYHQTIYLHRNSKDTDTFIPIMPEVYAAPPDYAFPRNFKGYGEKGLEGLKWPNDAKIAVSFVINYEEVSIAISYFDIVAQIADSHFTGRRALSATWRWPLRDLSA